MTFEMKLNLSVLEQTYAIVKLPRDEKIPAWATRGHFFSITKTADELSIVCEDGDVGEGPDLGAAERGWRVLKVSGPLDFSLTGILTALANPLANAGISIFAISTYDTDYLMVKNDSLNAACQCLEDSGFTILT